MSLHWSLPHVNPGANEVHCCCVWPAQQCTVASRRRRSAVAESSLAMPVFFFFFVLVESMMSHTRQLSHKFAVKQTNKQVLCTSGVYKNQMACTQGLLINALRTSQTIKSPCITVFMFLIFLSRIFCESCYRLLFKWLCYSLQVRCARYSAFMKNTR